MEVPSQSSRFSRCKNIEEYSNLQDITSDVEALKNDNFNLTLKSEIFERYLRKRCPALLIGVEKFAEQTSSLRSTLLLMTPRSSCESSVSGLSSDTTLSSSRLNRASHSPPRSSLSAYRISPLFKIGMVDRELEESRITMDRLRSRFESAKFLLETEEENIKSDITLADKDRVALENFMKQNIDKKTGRVFHDKFVRFIENKLQNGDRDLRKLKLKTKSLQIEYNRLLARYEQRLELRERLHPVDLNKLTIENKELEEKLEQKTKITMELKKVVGKKNQNLVSMKSKLNDIMLSLRSVRQDIKQKETKYKFTEEKEIKNVNELITAEIINQNMKKLNSTFKSPDAHHYLMVQMKLNELKSTRDMWERRCKHQLQSIALLEHQMKQLSPPQHLKHKSPYEHSERSRTLYSSKSADSMFRHFSRTSNVQPHCTPTTPNIRHW